MGTPNYDDSMEQLAKEIVALEKGDLVLAGIFANKPGYHNKRANLPSSDYSVREFAIDRQGSAGNASAIDITSKEAQGGNYTIINKYSQRLLAAGKANDPRMFGWREFFGQTDKDGSVEGWDFTKHEASTSGDKSHLWHIHLSEHRGYNTSVVNKDALMSVLKGETLAEYKAAGGKLLTTPPNNPAPAKLLVDGELGANTIKRWQTVMGTPADGVISHPSDLVKAVQRKLNTMLPHEKLEVDGEGINQDGKITATVTVLQKYLGTPVDGRLTSPSDAIKAVQTRLNAGHF
jgi:hypothetical protein